MLWNVAFPCTGSSRTRTRINCPACVLTKLVGEKSRWRVRGCALVSWRKHPLPRSCGRSQRLVSSSNTTARRPPPQSPGASHVSSQFAHLSAIAMRLRNTRFRFLGADRGFLLLQNGQVDGAPRLTADYGASMMARSICAHEVCSCCALQLAVRIIRVPAVVAPSVLIMVSLSDAI